jgi:DNA-binding MarR family transcriptional regulator
METASTSSARSASGAPQAVEDVAAGLERIVALIRWLSPPGMSLTSAATLSTLERSGPCRLTALATAEGVTQPAMTQLIGRLADAGLVAREADPADGRVVHVHITPAGRELVADRRTARAERLSRLLSALTPSERRALAAALPAMDSLVRAYYDEQRASTN